MCQKHGNIAANGPTNFCRVVGTVKILVHSCTDPRQALPQERINEAKITLAQEAILLPRKKSSLTHKMGVSSRVFILTPCRVFILTP